jgi:hypothetical protein
MHLRPDETDLVGRWILRDGQVVGDPVCHRVKALVSGPLERIAADETGWDTLYRDPSDGRLWEHTYPQSELHGGGPPRLTVIDPVTAQVKYGPAPSSGRLRGG